MKRYVYILGLLLCLGILITLEIPAVRPGLSHGGPLVRALNNARMLQIALSTHPKAETFLGPASFPLQLSELRRDEVLGSDLLDRMREDPGTYVIYNPQNRSPDAPFIRYFGPEGVSEMRVDGMGGFYSWDRWAKEQKIRTEQGAAANP